MRNLILVAGVAALAITTPAAAKPDKGGGGNGGGQAQAQRGGGGGGGQKAQRGGGGGGQPQAQRMERRGGGGGDRRAAQMQSRGGGGDRQMQRMERRGGGERQAQRMERRGGGERQAQRMERGGGNQRQAQQMERRNQQRFANLQSERGNRNRAERAQRNDDRQVRVENRGRGNREFRNDNRKVERQARFENRGNGNREFRVDNRRDQRFAIDNRGPKNREFRENGQGNRFAFRGNNGDRVQYVNRGFDQRDDYRGKWRDRDFQVADRDFAVRVLGANYFNPRSYDRVRNTVYYVNSGLPAAYYGGCPSGLTWDSWSCVPPYYAQTTFIGQSLPGLYSSNYFPQPLRYMYADTPDYYYRYGDGYVYQVNRSNNLIASLLPLIGAGLGVGMPFPYQGSSYYVPTSYQSFYPDYGYGGGGDYYRYANGYVYEIDGRSGYIEDVIPLLDRGYGVGQMLPAGYSYYNVPTQYRDYYYDNDDYYYRYAPGAIYQVDRDSQLITAIASLLTGGLSVGQPLPASYGVYNVPLSYRDQYYDTPDNWYRYSDGYIYRVDPTTQLITAAIQALV